ncbi:hypothetical protein [Bacillus paramycoides]|uniref:hypothetical protein n=1 Tax=Bacillus paramycoides TaxID=2026194 RepID=UPI000BF42AB8|nr:hypothetical protein [Bacillus paramycoides]PFD32593.1 hypothetical protein CN285_27515 [Bacillus cereus]PGM62493.1 hypothetical protein CN947_11400 [Bacillus cereus]
MKIQTVTLKELEVVKVDGEYQTRFVNDEVFPAFLTNYALKKGQEMGLIDTSIFTDLLKFQALAGVDKGKDVDLEALGQIDQTNMHKIIYLAFQGANPKEKLSFDDFLKRFHEPLVESMQLYATLITDVINQDPNQFAVAFQKSTNSGGNGEKK